MAEAAGGLDLPVLQGLGLGNVLPLPGCPPAAAPVVHGRLHPLGPGKDTISGHWELMGVVAPAPLRTYPEGFPPEITEQLQDATGRGILCNRPYSGGARDRRLRGAAPAHGGPDRLHERGQRAADRGAHREVPESELYAACAAAREIMRGEHSVGRVIARPFRGEPGAFERTDGRRDLAVDPPSRSYLEELRADGIPVHTVGKVGSVFNHVGVDARAPRPDQRQRASRPRAS